MLKNRLSVAACALLVAAVAIAQVSPEERIPISDPDRLETLGFSRHAENIFVWSKADLKGGVTQGDPPLAAPETWGSNSGYSSTLGVELQGYWDGEVRLHKDLDHGTSCLSGGFSFPAYAWAQVTVPEGAKLGFFRFWAFDSHETMDLRFALWESCQAGAGPPTHTLIGQAQTFLGVGDYASFMSLNDLTVDNRECAYVVRVRFADSGQDCQYELAVRKLQFTWTRQVSPGPATATFADVPTSHPFFRFVEALVDSGITAGCGNGNYCPNNPISRGEMAVFLAAALGLSWP